MIDYYYFLYHQRLIFRSGFNIKINATPKNDMIFIQKLNINYHNIFIFTKTEGVVYANYIINRIQVIKILFNVKLKN